MPSADRPPERLIEVLVAQALDDLDEHRLDVATALDVVARLAWAAAYDRRSDAAEDAAVRSEREG
ncbi:MAG TPA: hypothetical protein VGH76_10780 [Actinomycetospora sp.]|jgi:hypothetical protein|uniref:hypothetical protein n=1 Tax=Actinomycetospora sp. TaxID=1872135 RepID=UPI002F3FB756